MYLLLLIRSYFIDQVVHDNLQSFRHFRLATFELQERNS